MIGRRVVVRRGPGLLGMAARTAVVAGTATAVSGGIRRRQDERAEAAQVQQQPAQQPYTQPPSPAAAPDAGGAGISDEMLAKLGRLADLHANGALTDEEFAAQKARLLGA
jgi:hypothetical protein